MRAFVAIFMLFVSSLAFAGDDTPSFKATSLYVKAGHTGWIETSTTQTRVMSEFGPTFAVGLAGTLPSPYEECRLTWSAEFDLSVLRYHGSDLLTHKPRAFYSAYVGTTEEVTYHMRESWLSPRFEINPYVTLGHRSIFRTASPEFWNVVYARLGLEKSYHFASGIVCYSSTSIGAPLFAVNHAFYTNVGYWDRDHVMTGHLAPVTELGFSFPKGTSISLIYETMETGPSDGVRTHKIFGSGWLDFYQPSVKNRVIWLKFSQKF